MRYPIRLPIKEINGRPGADYYVLDLSSMGAKLESPVPLRLRDSVYFSFNLPGEGKEIHLGGQVVWVHPSLGTPPQYFIGIRLFQVHWELEQLVRRCQGLTLIT